MSPLALSLNFLQAQPDSRLVALAREGHEPAFEALVRRYRRELLSYCRRLQPQSGSAEDALQQALLQAWRALKAGAEVREVRPWLYRIAHNVTLNNLRVVVAVPHEIQDTAGGHEVDQLVEQRLQARAALSGMASLPALQRQVFVSTTLDGVSHEEVASALGLSSGAVRGLVYRARATLRAAAAALTPSPVVHWAIRRAEARTGATPAIAEALAGGGGAGVAAALAKGGAVLTIAGAVAGAGGVIVGHSPSHHRHPYAHMVAASHRPKGLSRADSTGSAAAGPAMRAGRTAAAEVTRAGNAGRRGAAPGQQSHDGGNSRGKDHGGSSAGSSGDGGSRGGSDGGSSTGSRSGSDGGSASGTTVPSVSGGSSSGSTGGSDGGSSGSSGGSISTSSGSDGGTSGGTDGQLASAATSSAVTSTSDGGSSGSSGTSDSGDTTTTTTTSGTD